MKKSIRHSMAFLLFSFALICITLKVSGQNTLTEISKKNFSQFGNSFVKIHKYDLFKL